MQLDPEHQLANKYDETLQKINNELQTLELMQTRIQSRLDIIEVSIFYSLIDHVSL
jgi:hypothetical protein